MKTKYYALVAGAAYLTYFLTYGAGGPFAGLVYPALAATLYLTGRFAVKALNS